MLSPTRVRENLERVRARIAAAAARAKRPVEQIKLVAVTKTVGPEEVRILYDLGARYFGENRVQEALSKMDALKDLREARWHMIGRLQTNKVNKVLGRFELIHSVDSLRLAKAIHDRSQDRPTPVLVEVNISGETSKGGVPPEELPALLRQITAMANIRVLGLMTMAPLVDDPEKARPIFRRLRQARDSWNAIAPADAALVHLSMGMSQDFEVAIEEGADIVRIGSALFAES